MTVTSWERVQADLEITLDRACRCRSPKCLLARPSAFTFMDAM